MSDYDRSNSKTDVLFFARHVNSGKSFHVLVQLTLAKFDEAKVNASFEGMLKLPPLTVADEKLIDFRLFIGPNRSLGQGNVYLRNFCKTTAGCSLRTLKFRRHSNFPGASCVTHPDLPRPCSI